MNRKDQEFLIRKLRAQYGEKEHTALDELRALDKRVKRPANAFAYTFGILSALVMGAGMSLVMTDVGAMLGFSSSLLPGVVIGSVGLVLALVNYPIFKRILNARRKRYATEILALSERIMNR